MSNENHEEGEEIPREARANPLVYLVRSQGAIEKIRVATQVRSTHLKLRGRVDPETDALLAELKRVEEFVDGLVAERMKSHPAHPWFSCVKGVGRENIGKVVGRVDITKANTISSLWKFAGYHTVDGKALRPVSGKKLESNKALKTMCWRLAVCLMKARGKFYDYYVKEKEKYLARFEREGVKVVPSAQLPKKDGKFYEPAGMISEGHVHNMALRKMIKLFLSCLWYVWRTSEGLPTRVPYPVEYLGHTTIIDPWEMVNKPEKKPRKKKVA